MSRSTATTDIYALFSQLAELKSDTRVTAASKLLKQVQENDDNLEYSVGRLVRGVSSSRAAARQGFALGLCTLLRQGQIKDVDGVVTKLELDTKTSKNEKGEEERDNLIGRGFGYLAVVRSGAASNQVKLRIARGLVSLAKEKSWIRELCASVMCALVEDATGDSNRLDELQGAFQGFLQGEEKDPEKLAVFIALERARGRDNYDLLLESNFAQLSKPLAAAWRANPPRLHLVWQQLCPLCASDGLGKMLWTQVVEPALIRGGLVSPERKCAGFLVFAQLATDLAKCDKPEEIPEYMLSRSTIGSIITHAKSKTKALNEPARKALSSLVAALNSNVTDPAFDRARLATIRSLLRFGDFDGQSATDTCHQLLTKLGDDSIQQHFAYLKEQMESTKKAWTVYAITELARAHPGKPIEREILTLLFDTGFFEDLSKPASSKPAPAKPKPIKSKAPKSSDDDEEEDEDAVLEDDDDAKRNIPLLCRQRFFTVISKVSKSASVDFVELLRELHSNWASKVSSTKKRPATHRVRRAETDEFSASLLACKELGDWLNSNRDAVGEANANIVKALESLILFMGLLLLVPADDDEDGESDEFLKIDIQDLVDDLKEASKRIVESLLSGSKKPSKKKKQQSDEAQMDDPIAVAVDVMLALLAQPSSLVRELIATLAKALAGNIVDSKPALETLMDVLTKSHKPSKPDQTDAEEEEEEVEEDPDEDDDDDEAEDALPSNKSYKHKSSSNGEHDDEEGEDEDEEENEEDAVEEMEAYDRALSEFLKQRKASTQKAREAAAVDAEKTQITFKLRVLDILDAIVSRAAEHANIVLLPVQLLKSCEVAAPPSGKQSLKEAKKKQLQGPASSLMHRLEAVQNKLFKSKQLPETVDDTELEQCLSSVIEIVNQTKSKEVASLGLSAICFYLKVASKRSDKLASKLKATLPETLAPVISAIFVGHSNHAVLDSKTIQSFLERLPESTSWIMLPVVCGVTARTPFQRAQQVGLVSRMLQMRKDSIPEADLSILRSFVLAVLSKEEEDAQKGKGNPGRLRDALKFAKQVLAVGSQPDFVTSLEEVFIKIIRISNSPNVKQMLLSMSSSKSALQAAADDAAAKAISSTPSSGKKRSAAESSEKTAEKSSKKFFQDVAGSDDEDEEDAKPKKQQQKQSKKRLSSEVNGSAQTPAMSKTDKKAKHKQERKEQK